MNKTYGIPYQGSKSKIAKEIINVLPANDYLVDLVAGGCAITHCGMLSKKWKCFIANDITCSAKAFEAVINHTTNIDFKHPQLITREKFKEIAGDTDNIDNFLLSIIWSFGNNRRTYIYGEDKEKIKTYSFLMLSGKDFNVRLKNYELFMSELMKTKIDRHTNEFQHLENIHRLQSLENFRRMESLERIRIIQNFDKFCSNITTTQNDYRNITIPANSTIYCDIPYQNTGGYTNIDFNHNDFYDWCLQQKQPVFISEYSMPDDFVEIYYINHKSTFSATNNNKLTIEKIFVQKKFADKIKINKQTKLF